jgi:hypothetical protein
MTTTVGSYSPSAQDWNMGSKCPGCGGFLLAHESLPAAYQAL